MSIFAVFAATIPRSKEVVGQQDYWGFAALLSRGVSRDAEGHVTIDPEPNTSKPLFYELADGRQRLAEPFVSKQWMDSPTDTAGRNGQSLGCTTRRIRSDGPRGGQFALAVGTWPTAAWSSCRSDYRATQRRTRSDGGGSCSRFDSFAVRCGSNLVADHCVAGDAPLGSLGAAS